MEAQYYVGEIYQRGLGAAPKYSRAAKWYRKAAEQGYSKAQMSLAYLYEKGLGVAKDPQQALRWYRRATGLGDSISLDENILSIEERRELQELREEVKRHSEETRMLRQQLEQIQKDLEDSRRKLNQRSRDTKNETQRQDVARLKSEVARYEAETEALRRKLAQAEGMLKTLPAPVDFSAIDFGRYHALIIGIINYSKLPRLKTAVNDALEIAKILRDKYGFNTKLLLDAKSDDIMQALNQFRKTLTENDNLLIYYAGHGVLDDKNNRGYWQPIDADPDSTANWIPDIMITDQLNLMAAKEVLIIADSCYSGALTRGVIAQLESTQSVDVRLQYIEELAKGRARMVLSSGELAPVLDAGRGGHSVFANVLLDVLKSNDQVIEGNRLHQEMSAFVVSESKRFGLTQVPQYASNIQAGHQSGDFIFVPQN